MTPEQSSILLTLNLITQHLCAIEQRLDVLTRNLDALVYLARQKSGLIPNLLVRSGVNPPGIVR